MVEATQREAGVVFPTADGRRSTSATGRAVVADAARVGDVSLAASVERERDWRRGYVPAFRGLTLASMGTAEDAHAMARAGLESVHDRFRWAGADGAEAPLAAAWDVPAEPLTTTDVRGEGQGGPSELSLPYRGGRIAGDDLRRRLDAWVRDGVAEASLAAAVARVSAHPEWLDLRDTTVVVLGAAAEMGPYVSLVRWGAHVVPVDLPGPAWTRLLAEARRSPGRVSAPGSAGGAGLDVTTEAPRLLAWLRELDGPLTVGHYVYADGAQHVRTSVAVDALTAVLLAERDDVALAFLATPTDSFVVPEGAVEESRARRATAPAWTGALRSVAGGRAFSPAYRRLHSLADGRLVGLNDSLVRQQGPNYALAKRIQRWRAETARRDGVRVSLNVAPATRTRSVLRNRVLAAGYAGAHRFGVQVFDPATSNTLMAALLVHDLRHDTALAAPGAPLSHPAELYWENACHSGLWRAPWSARSVLGFAVGLGLLPRG